MSLCKIVYFEFQVGNFLCFPSLTTEKNRINECLQINYFVFKQKKSGFATLKVLIVKGAALSSFNLSQSLQSFQSHARELQA
jgi:hypothetical protein